MTTTIPTVRAYLRGLLETAMDIQVLYGQPEVYELHECLSLMGVQPHLEEDRAVGNQGRFRDEVYTLNLILKVFKGGTSTTTAEKVEERTWALFQDVHDAVHADRAPDVLPSGWWHVESATTDGTLLTGNEGNAGWQCLVDIGVFCRSRVTT